MRRSSCLPLVALVSCLVPEAPRDGLDTGAWLCDAEARLDLPGASGQGDWEIPFVLAHPDAEPADVSLRWSEDDGASWRFIATEGETLSLATSSEGITHSLTWRTFEDLGYTPTEGLQLRLAARSACGLWPRDIVAGLSVDNAILEDPPCEIELEAPASSVDGETVLRFVLRHPASTPVWIDTAWSDDDGESWRTLAWITRDCDDDGEPDGRTDLETSPEGTPHCLAWDTEENLSRDAEVRIRLECGVGFDTQDMALSDPFLVENDPRPDPGELVFHELLPLSSSSAGDYLELLNRAGHTLDLEGVSVARWRASAPTSGPPSTSFTVHDVTETILLPPGGILLVGASESRSANGCIDPDLLWGAFTLNDNSTLRLLLDDAVLAELSILDLAGWDFPEGVALGLDPARVDADEWNTPAAWCAQTTRIPVCASSSNTDDGTPGRSNDACP